MGSWRTDPAEGFVVIGGYPTATLTWRTPHTLKQSLKYSEDQPRDEHGRFTETGGGDTIAQLQASLPTTTEPRRTHFLLPDGTRLTNPPEHGAHSAHAVLAHRAGVTLDEVVAAGGVRYLSIAGVEVGAPLTTRQADILIDDWFGYNTSLSIDVAVGGSIVASREFDIPNGEVSAGTLQSWVQARLDAHAADRRKWSEEQHPRVPAGGPGGGQFTSTDGGVTGAGGESSRVSFPTVHSVDEAIAKIGDGEGVMFTQPMEAVVMVEKLARELEHAEGEKKVYNLCQVQVRDTNFFCSAESKIPRSEMPQLTGQAIPGTPADHLPRNRWGEVDASEQFRQHLRSQGVDVIQQAVLVSRMRPTQNEMDTYKIAQIVKVVKTYEREGLPTTPMWMSRDNYIIDGHHRWAATALLSIKGKADRIEAYVVNLPVFKLLKEARTFSKQIGIRQLAVGKSVACAVCLALKYSEDQHAPHDPSLAARTTKAMNADREDLPALIARADRLEPLMRRKFLQAIKEAKAAINLSDLAQAVRTGNMVRVTESLKLAELEGRLKVGTTETLRLGYMAGARVGADRLESVNVRVRFDLMSPHAVQWAEKHAGRLITEITANQRLGVQQLMADAQRLGRTVDETARDLKTFIGLHSRQQDAIEKLRTRLEARDLTEESIDKKVGRYAEGLLNQRARTIARTEMVQAAHYGQREQWDQAAAQGLFDKTTTRREWITTVDDLTDVPICLEMDGQTVGYDELWELPDGHGSVKIPGESHPNCRCAEELLFDQ